MKEKKRIIVDILFNAWKRSPGFMIGLDRKQDENIYELYPKEP